MSIQEAIEHGKDQLDIFGGEHREFIEMAIKSLEAWEKVKKEIDEATEMLPDGDFYIKNFDVKRIIDKHYSEVEE